MLTKIVATIGPASQEITTLRTLVQAGVNVVRLNFSHGDHEYHGKTITNARLLEQELGKAIPILLDTKGPEMRTGKLVGGESIILTNGETIVVTTTECEGTAQKLYINYPTLIQDCQIGQMIMIADGLIQFQLMKKISADQAECLIVNGGKLGEKKNVNLPGVIVNLPAMSEKDRDDLRFGCTQKVDFIAASFIRKASDVREIRAFLDANGGKYIKIISKIENQEGIDNFEQILEVTDGVMVARGDLGVDIPLHQVPLAQKMMIHACNRVGKPVITATQMLESMIVNPRATRAEVADIANAILDGTDAVMLSGETAGGSHPLLAVQTMRSVCDSIDASDIPTYRPDSYAITYPLTEAIAKGAVETAQQLGAKAIVIASTGGTTARAVRKFGTNIPLLVCTQHHETWRQSQLIKGVSSVLVKPFATYDEFYAYAQKEAKKTLGLQSGDQIVVVGGGSVGDLGATSSLKVIGV